jgi:aryl-phospho-beta-D-glucosidase BglC (GH1 family)
MLTTIIAAVATLPALTCKGNDLVRPDGTPVRLRGVNLGGWLVEEMWMTPWMDKPPTTSDLPKIEDHVSLWGVVEKRFGHDGMVRVRDEWRDNWITDADFARIKDAGFDHVRIPFLDSLIEEPNGLRRLHGAVEMAARHGLYSVLDMHGAPGRQNESDHSGQVKKNRLWFDVENITKMEELWATLGREFGNDPNVAMFDLMNEPMGAPNPAMLFLVYDRVYRAVRKTAPNKVIVIEDGYKGFETTPHPNLAQWTNVCYSLHFYNFDAKTSNDHVSALKSHEKRDLELQGYRQAPLYIGEFNLEPHGNPEVMREFTGEMTRAGWSWALWTYKTDAKAGPMGQWGLYRRPGKPVPLNPYTDSEADLIAKMRSVRTENFEPAPGILAAFKGG